MPNSSENQASDNSGLEDRLRGLILNNSKTVPKEIPGIEPNPPPYFPPHLLGATDGQKQEYLKSLTELPPASKSQGQQSQRSKRRPNQAQRRQGSSQMLIPTATTPAIQGYQHSRGFSPASSFSSPTHQYDIPSVPSYQGYTKSSQFPTPIINHQASPFTQTQFQQPLRQAPLFESNTGLQGRPMHQLATLTAGFDNQNLHQWRRGAAQINAEVPSQYGPRPIPRNPQLFQFSCRGRGASFGISPEQIASQCAFLEMLANQRVSQVGIDEVEVRQKEEFRMIVEQACRDAITAHEQKALGKTKFDPNSVELKCFGSMASGFATKTSDMDLALLAPHSAPPPDSPKSPIPRLLEKKLLEMGFGARLLTRTRVPIIKLCQRPTTKLMSDLLEERSKWENGFGVEDDADAEDDINDRVADQEDDGKNPGEDNLVEPVEGVSGKKPVAANYEERLRSFKQKETQSLLEYYNSAKRLLRSLGCRDVTTTTESSQDNDIVLQGVCKAFLNGLADKTLRTRLLSYHSLSLLLTDKLTTPQSLSGIFAQTEGEQLAYSWDNRPLPEATHKAEAECSRLIVDWRNFMNNISLDTLVYNRNLHQAVDRLKRIPSLQLMFLEQGLYEDPLAYYVRAKRILNELGGRDLPSKENYILEVVKMQYLAGTKDLKIQEKLRMMVSDEELVSLRSLMLQHRILQLANDYETAVSKDLYSQEDQIYITQYVHFLRTGVLHHPSTSSTPDPTVVSLKITHSTAPLIRKIQSIPDPSQMVHQTRDRYKDHLEFPKTDIGIQCDINFSARLALHNTRLLRCYSLTDSRVKPMILFVKHWAKLRAINNPYRGSLSSYGYVLMVLHYLVNIAEPFVCPNLQHLRRELPSTLSPAEITARTTCNGCDVQFWCNEKEITNLAERGMLNHNRESLGALLRGFFEYFANTGQLSTGGRGFDWGREVLSLRARGGILLKQEKGWVGARTVMETTTEAAPTLTLDTANNGCADVSKMSNTTQTTQYPKKAIIKEEVKEIRYRYLFCIEDPFELDHNVARTVTHKGICSIRDELRRAWRIIKSVGRDSQGLGQVIQEGLMDEVSGELQKSALMEFFDEIHGKLVSDEGETAA
jgi:terminal uridylyltransferase